MIIYLPCKIGEEFTRLKFKDWVNGKRIYEEGGSRTLRGFDAFDCTTRSLAIPTIHADRGAEPGVEYYTLKIHQITERRGC